jgi:hypothetical protein
MASCPRFFEAGYDFLLNCNCLSLRLRAYAVLFDNATALTVGIVAPGAASLFYAFTASSNDFVSGSIKEFDFADRK